MKTKLLILVSIVSICLSCNTESKSSKTKIICTTSMIGDLVQNLVGDSVEVISLMGAGVDPHLYKPTSQDIQALKSGDMIFYNGLHLEGKMQEVLEKLSINRPVHAITNGIPESMLIKTSEFKGNFDPHIWFDAENWMFCTAYVSKKLIEKFPQFSESIKLKEESYSDELKATDELVHSLISEIPQKKRQLVTAHDAFSYFGRAYGMNVKALQGISTLSSFGLKDVLALSEFLIQNEIKAVFVESSVPNKSLQKVIETASEKDHQVIIGGNLFSDAMGKSGSPEGTYIGMLIHNATTISENLK